MLSLYIHIPFCVRKCHYCGFYSTIYTSQGADELICAIQREAEQYKSLFMNRTIETVYIGGGTPTVLSLQQWKHLLAVIRENFKIVRGAEYTIEANPNSLSKTQLSLLKEMGVNRLSLGVQSFSDDLLEFLGRSHSARQGAAAFKTARNAGFDNIGIDLIYGIPGQSEAEWRRTLIKTAQLRPEHISGYSLSIDEGSRFSEKSDNGKFSLPDDELVAVQYEVMVSEFKKAGYEQYEISNFSLPGFACRHNINYWERGEYLGLGPAAWSFIKKRRYRAIADLGEYCIRVKAGSPPVEYEEAVDTGQAANETIMLSLRTSRGLDLNRYEQEYGSGRVQQLEEKAVPLERSGLLEKAEGRLRLTEHGFLVANEVLEKLIS